jgi:NADH:ubiquinone oxidoreductase subunit B-like Fe-S oxidoreductase
MRNPAMRRTSKTHIRPDAATQIRRSHRACACSGGIFEGNYNVVGGVDKIIPVNAYIPGCPPRPEALIDGVVKLLNALDSPKENKSAKKAKEIAEAKQIAEQ